MLGLTRRNPETALAQPPRPAMERWNPWGEFDRIRAEMDRLFGGLVGTAPRWTVEPGVFTPTVDLYETTDEVVVNVYLPGMSREDIHLEVMGNTLRLYGETKPAVPEKDVTVHLAEGTYGRFEFRYALPVEVKAEECRAAYRNGVLEVRLPKAESAKPKPVEIRVEG